ncbi:hypothetical protein CMV_006494 [Castanea mollissima]|uniref:Glutathione S-transferase n=1 Tax=Castanea mollissima TaxID=60419 RepID=A0A8J4RAQ2_9ROSI|nr:hypothetical protein CMV_006494 [Castanea mollissima]
MAEETKVRLHGMWASPFVRLVKLTLEIKDIQSEYVEEDLENKSLVLLNYNPIHKKVEEDLVNKSLVLLKYNPIHKKVPVLVVNGKPLVESLIILEYIDETWRNGPRFLPEDPYKKAQLRFWCSFVHKQVFETMMLVLTSYGEEQEKAAKEFFERLSTLEEEIKNIFPEGIQVIDQRNVGLLDLVVVTTLSHYKAQEEYLGLKLIDPEMTPLLFSWLTALLE